MNEYIPVRVIFLNRVVYSSHLSGYIVLLFKWNGSGERVWLLVK